MIVGTVHPNGDAVATIRLRGATGKVVDIEAIIDTGFNDALTLPPELIDDLELAFREEGDYILADGTESTSRMFAAEIDWFGRWRKILIIEIEGDSLLGMAILRGSFLGIEVIDGGRVEIRPLAP